MNKNKGFVTFSSKKQACLDNRNMDLKKGNLDIFWKEIVHNLVKKLIFFLSFLSKIGREKVFIDGLDSKEALKDNKNRSLWETQTWDFSKGGSPSFSSKV